MSRFPCDFLLFSSLFSHFFFLSLSLFYFSSCIFLSHLFCYSFFCFSLYKICFILPFVLSLFSFSLSPFYSLSLDRFFFSLSSFILHLFSFLPLLFSLFLLLFSHYSHVLLTFVSYSISSLLFRSVIRRKGERE